MTCAFKLLPSISKPISGFKPIKRRNLLKPSGASPSIAPQRWIWRVPPGVLSNAGCLVVLRARQNKMAASGDEDEVTAQITTDSELREVVFG